MTDTSSSTARRPPVAMLGVPFDNVTMDEAVEVIAGMIASRQPHYVATANVDFVVQASADVELRRILFDAHLVLCDGMPLVWASRHLGNPLPGRVTGADLVPRLLAEAERRRWRVFFLGGSPETLEKATAKSFEKHPGLHLVGAYSPPFRPLLEMDHADLIRRVSGARPDLLLVAFGCPKQEKWINMHYRHLGVPVSIGVGATLDFIAGTFKRAPVWMQRTGTEWIFRLLQEPGRLAKRYGKDLFVFSRAIFKQARQLRSRPPRPSGLPPANVPGISAPAGPVVTSPSVRGPGVLVAPERLDAVAVVSLRDSWTIAVESGPVIVDGAATTFIDSTGVGLLVRLRKRAREKSHSFRLAALNGPALAALQLMQLESFFDRSPDVATAVAQIAGRNPDEPVVRVTTTKTSAAAVSSATVPATVPAKTAVPPGAAEERLQWHGEVTAATVAVLAEPAENRLTSVPPGVTVTIDLAQVPFADSSGVGLMVRLKKRAWQRDVKVVFSNPSPSVANVLRLTRLEEYLLGGRA